MAVKTHDDSTLIKNLSTGLAFKSRVNYHKAFLVVRFNSKPWQSVHF